MRGWTAATLRNALLISEAIAHGKTHCEKPFYHVSFRLVHGEELKPEQWEHCADKPEQRLGWTSIIAPSDAHLPRRKAFVMAGKWDRIDENTLKAVNLFQDRPKCKEVARELEKAPGCSGCVMRNGNPKEIRPRREWRRNSKRGAQGKT